MDKNIPLLHEVRKQFLDFFMNRGYTIQSSAPLVPQKDNTLFFVNSGMVPFKGYFLDLETPPEPRLTSCQASFRVSGKHNDLNEVGSSLRHHTLFEMLGNFVFGKAEHMARKNVHERMDIKAQSIQEAWIFLTEHMKLSPERLVVTYYCEDPETALLWKKISSLPEHHIVSVSTQDNFWSMGTLGPCGPCTEIFYLHTPELYTGFHSLDACALEIWNLVFMSFEDQETGRIPLPYLSLDTGMGLERLMSVLEGTFDTYNTVFFRRLMEILKKSVPHKIQTHNILIHNYDTPWRIAADHLRAVVFLMAEGLLPQRDGRGYVLRRLIRRMVFSLHNFIPHPEDMMISFSQGIQFIIQEFLGAYPYLMGQEHIIQSLMIQEVQSAFRVLESSIPMLRQVTSTFKPGQILPKERAFELYDTYGVPLDFLTDSLAVHQIQVDEEGFLEELEHQKKRSRDHRKENSQNQSALQHDALFSWVSQQLPSGENAFVGYEHMVWETKVVALGQWDGSSWISRSEIILEGEEKIPTVILVSETPFYGESGGQEGDRGTFESERETVFEVKDTHRVGNWIVHEGLCTNNISVGQPIKAVVDKKRRQGLMIHHSTTHLLHRALKDILGSHVSQKGSLVKENYLRFDFSHSSPLTSEQKDQVEQHIWKVIQNNVLVNTSLQNPVEALKSGVVSLAGERYPDEARVVCMGDSSEFCGGTHVQRTGDIGGVSLIAESGIASGVRRIEMVSGLFALENFQQERQEALKITHILGSSRDTNVKYAQNLVQEHKELKKKYQSCFELLCREQSHSVPQEIVTSKEDLLWKIYDGRSLGWNLESVQAVRNHLMQEKNSLGVQVVLILGREKKSSDILFSLGYIAKGDHIKKITAQSLAQDLIRIFGGKGGGNFSLAQGHLTRFYVTEFIN